MQDSPLKVYRGDAPVNTSRPGFAQVTNEVTGRPKPRKDRELSPDTALSSDAKVMYAAIVQNCRDGDTTYATVDELCASSGLPRRSGQRAVAELKSQSIIDRRQDWSKRLCPWMTLILVDKKGGTSKPKDESKTDLNIDTESRHGWRTPAPRVAHPRATGGAPPCISLRQTLLDFPQTTTTTNPESSSGSISDGWPELVARAIAMFPDVEPEPDRIAAVLLARGQSIDLLIETLDLAARLRRRYPKTHELYPRTFRWVESTMRNWAGRSIETFRRENLTIGPLPSAPKPAEQSRPAPKAEPVRLSDPIPPGGATAFIADRRAEFLRNSAVGEKKTDPACSAKNPAGSVGASEVHLRPIVHDKSNGDEPHRHCARQDSNLQHTDSKSATLGNSPQSAPEEPPEDLDVRIPSPRIHAVLDFPGNPHSSPGETP